MTEKTYEKLLHLAFENVKQGRSVILDATFAQRSQRDQLKARLNSKRICFRFIEAQSDDDHVKQRLQERESKPDEISDARLEDFESLTRIYEPPGELPRHQFLSVDTTASLQAALAFGLKSLVTSQLEFPSPP